MGRPNKYNLHYFPLDVDFFDDHKILSVEEDFGVKGGYIAIRIMAMVYKDNGYYLEWPDKFEYTAAKRVGNGFTGALVGEIFKSCIKHDLFDKTLFEKYHIVTSRGIQKRWKEVQVGMRRKVSVSSKLWLISSEDITVSSEEITTPATFSTQKETKGKETKLKPNGVAPAKPPPTKKVTKKRQKEPPEPHWQQLVRVWFDFNKQKFKTEPSFEDREPSLFKKIVQHLKKRSDVEWSERTATDTLRKFLNDAFMDSWLKEHFLLENLLKQFNMIIREKTNQLASASTPKNILPKLARDLNYLYGSFLEGRINITTMGDEHYTHLLDSGVKYSKEQKESWINAAKNYITENEIKNLSPDGWKSLQRRFAVIEHFKFLKKQGHETVFRVE